MTIVILVCVDDLGILPVVLNEPIPIHFQQEEPQHYDST
jgi:hypothetical protein